MRSHRAVGTTRPSARRAGTSPSSVIRRRAAQAAAVELEQLGEHAGHHPLADRGARPAVPRDAGRGELVLDEAGVRPVGREQHGDAVEPGAGPGGVDDGAHGDAHLVVGVGRGDDLDVPDRARRAPSTPDGTGWPASPSARARTEASASASPVMPSDELDVAALGQRGQQLVLERAQPLGEVDDDARARRAGRSAAARSAARASRSPSSYHSWAQQPGDLGGDPGRLVAAGRAGQRGQRPGPGEAQLAVEVAQGDDGRGVVVDAGVEARRVVDDPLDGEVDDRRRHRVAALGVERRRPEQLGERGTA